MPYKFSFEHIPMPRDADARIKLTDDEREDIIEQYKRGVAVRQIAREYAGRCSRRLIQFIIRPDLKEQNIQRRAERGGSVIYYNREKNTQAMRKHRRRKKTILTERGLI